MLDLAWNGVTDDGARVLTRVLHFNKTLEELDLTCNRISHDGAVALCEGLRTNSTLRVLKVGQTVHGPEGFTLCVCI